MLRLGFCSERSCLVYGAGLAPEVMAGSASMFSRGSASSFLREEERHYSFQQPQHTDHNSAPMHHPSRLFQDAHAPRELHCCKNHQPPPPCCSCHTCTIARHNEVNTLRSKQRCGSGGYMPEASTESGHCWNSAQEMQACYQRETAGFADGSPHSFSIRTPLRRDSSIDTFHDVNPLSSPPSVSRMRSGSRCSPQSSVLGGTFSPKLVPENQIAICKWFPIRVPGSDASLICLGGYLVYGVQGSEFVKSEPIVERLQKQRVKCADGVIFLLMGHLDMRATLANGFSSKVADAFYLGFPFSWQSTLSDDQKFYTARRSVRDSPPTAPKEVSNACNAAMQAQAVRSEAIQKALEAELVIENLRVEPDVQQSRPMEFDTPFQTLSTHSEPDFHLESEPAEQVEAEVEFTPEVQVEVATADVLVSRHEPEPTAAPESMVATDPTVAPEPTAPPTAAPEPTEPPAAAPEPTEPTAAAPEHTEPTTAAPEPAASEPTEPIAAPEPAVAEQSQGHDETATQAIQNQDETEVALLERQKAGTEEPPEVPAELDGDQCPGVVDDPAPVTERTSRTSSRKRSRSKSRTWYSRKKSRSKKATVKEPALPNEPGGEHASADENQAADIDNAKDDGKQADAVEADEPLRTPDNDKPTKTKARRPSRSKKSDQKASGRTASSLVNPEANKEASPASQKAKRSVPPPLPPPRVTKGEVMEAYGLKTSRSGRLLVPPLAYWRNQTVARDKDGGIIAILEGFEEGPSDTGYFNFKPPSQKRKLQEKLCAVAESPNAKQEEGSSRKEKNDAASKSSKRGGGKAAAVRGKRRK